MNTYLVTTKTLVDAENEAEALERESNTGGDIVEWYAEEVEEDEEESDDLVIIRHVPENWNSNENGDPLEETNPLGPKYLIKVVDCDNRDYEDRMATVLQRFAELLPDNDVDRRGMEDRLRWIMQPLDES